MSSVWYTNCICFLILLSKDVDSTAPVAIPVAVWDLWVAHFSQSSSLYLIACATTALLSPTPMPQPALPPRCLRPPPISTTGWHRSGPRAKWKWMKEFGNTMQFSLAPRRPPLFNPSSSNMESLNQGLALFSARLMYSRKPGWSAKLQGIGAHVAAGSRELCCFWIESYDRNQNQRLTW